MGVSGWVLAVLVLQLLALGCLFVGLVGIMGVMTKWQNELRSQVNDVRVGLVKLREHDQKWH